MLLKVESHLQAFVIRHPTIKAVIYQRIGDVDSFSEDLVQMPAQFMGDGVGVHCPREAIPHQFGLHVFHVVVEITTHHHTCIGILSEDVIDQPCDSPCSFLLERLFSRLKVAVEYLHLFVTSCQAHPAKVGAECFHQGQSHLVGGSCPTSTIALEHRLVGPVIIQEEGILQLGLIQADEVNLILANELTYFPLLLFAIEASISISISLSVLRLSLEALSILILYLSALSLSSCKILSASFLFRGFRVVFPLVGALQLRFRFLASSLRHFRS